MLGGWPLSSVRTLRGVIRVPIDVRRSWQLTATADTKHSQWETANEPSNNIRVVGVSSVQNPISPTEESKSVSRAHNCFVGSIGHVLVALHH